MHNYNSSARSRMASRGAKLTIVAGTGLSLVLLTGSLQASSARESTAPTGEQGSTGELTGAVTSQTAGDYREDEAEDDREDEDERDGDREDDGEEYGSDGGSSPAAITRPPAPAAAPQPAPPATMSSQS